MRSIIPWGLIAVICLLIVVLLLVTGVWRRQKKVMLPAILLLMAGLGAGAYAAWMLVSKSYRHTWEILTPRSGIEAYSALFGTSTSGCVSVSNFTDQVIPRLDCCIWMELTTCPPELNRILQRNGFIRLLPGEGADTAMPNYSPRPKWFRPPTGNNSLLIFRHYNPDNHNRDEWLYASADSTHVFFCSMAD